MPLSSSSVPIKQMDVSTYAIPTDFAESDGTLEWDRTTIVIVIVSGGNQQGVGYTYADNATASLIHDTLRPIVCGADALSPSAIYMACWRRIRNLGRPGICSMAISAVDCAVWDLKARLLGAPLVTLLGQVRQGAAIYGSGGFTSYSDKQLVNQLAGWIDRGIPSVKMKVGRDRGRDRDRVRVAREAIGKDAQLFVDANGAYTRREALRQASIFDEFDVSWFEEPVSSDDLDGLRWLRDHAPVRMDIAAGEYGYDIFYFQRMLAAQAVDVQQADITRCGGVTGFMQVATLCQSFNIPLSCHTSPALHTHVACAAPPFRNLEYFHDHVRIEQMLFDGLPQLIDGELRPDLSRPGTGLEIKRSDAEKFAA
ncbi:MAG TPA: enolase C-terminal domain-like protein [Candidatus Sulfotelmatobacter sp.]|jgi:L-alanine-DL-glutamate epimerase-like enolase superfamily enzyme|nr:enolase C-terminal domain-like protein [Acidobacteriaceae bacterium]